MDKAGPVFLQLGAVGAIALILLAAVRFMYQQQITELKASIDREVAGRERDAARADAEIARVTARAERAEQKTEDLHDSVQRDIVPALVDASRAVQDSHQVIQALATARGS